MTICTKSGNEIMAPIPLRAERAHAKTSMENSIIRKKDRHTNQKETKKKRENNTKDIKKISTQKVASARKATVQGKERKSKWKWYTKKQRLQRLCTFRSLQGERAWERNGLDYYWTKRAQNTLWCYEPTLTVLNDKRWFHPEGTKSLYISC